MKIDDGPRIHDDIEIALYSGQYQIRLFINRIALIYPLLSTDADLVVYITQRSIVNKYKSIKSVYLLIT